MPSKALTEVLEPLLEDAKELSDAHRKLRSRAPGRVWGLGGLNRAVAVMTASAWEAYVEHLVLEAIEALKPAPATLVGHWPSLSATARGLVGRFNTPNSQNVSKLFRETIGLQDVSKAWDWNNSNPVKSREMLDAALGLRHKIAHGVNPRPTVVNSHAVWLPSLFRRLAKHTDDEVASYLVGACGIVSPW